MTPEASLELAHKLLDETQEELTKTRLELDTVKKERGIFFDALRELFHRLDALKFRPIPGTAAVILDAQGQQLAMNAFKAAVASSQSIVKKFEKS